MDGYITVQEAADLLGVSRTSVYRRLRARTVRVQNADSAEENAVQNADSAEENAVQNADSAPDSVLQGGIRYVSKEWVESQRTPVQNADSADGNAHSTRTASVQNAYSTRTEPVQHADSDPDGLKPQIIALEKALLESQGKIETLQATVTAQEAHIASLQRALDAEQALHMTSLQRLPAGRGFMAWIKGWGKKE